MTARTPANWPEVERLYTLASSRPDADRESWLESQGADEETLGHVRAMLRASVEMGGFLERDDDEPQTDLAADLVGSTLGRYRLVRHIGSGGMAHVFEGVRADRVVEHRVAVKVLRRGIDSDDVLRRFGQERRLLAGLRHPGIAAFVDSGMAATGTPYLVMQLVDGEPIDQFVRSRALSVHDICRLVAEVCELVQFAHNSLVVHRDLKPSNVMVTQGRTPVLLDFGIAKVIDPQTPAHSTAGRGTPMTPDYAAPEQIRGARITTRCDIYALGVLLRELLTGVKAREIDPRAEPSRVIRERRDAGLDTGPASADALRGDLDTIVLRAIADDPDRRYATASALAEDLRRHVVQDRVLARRDTLSYRVSRSVRRRPFTTLVVTALASMLLATTFLSLRSADDAIRARDLAALRLEESEMSVAFFREIFAGSGFDLVAGTQRPLVALLDEGGRLLDESDVETNDEVRARLYELLGSGYDRLTYREQAAGRFMDAAELYRRIDGPSSQRSARVGARSEFSRDRGVLRQVRVIAPESRRDFEMWGANMAISPDGRRLAVWVRHSDEAGPGAGAVDIVDLETDQVVYTLLPEARPGCDHQFGFAIALTNEFVLVGDRNDDRRGPRAGRAEIFRLDTGDRIGEFVPPDIGPETCLGNSIAVEGDRVLIGAYRQARPETFMGAVYVFDLASRQMIRKLTPPDPKRSARFGSSVRLWNGIAVVAAGSMRTHARGTGKVYTFDVDTGEFLRSFIPRSVPEFGDFGSGAKLDRGQALFGAPGNPRQNPRQTGRAYLYDLMSGELLHEITPSDATMSDRFGAGRALVGRFLICSATEDDDNGPDSGAVYVFDRRSGEQLTKVVGEHDDPILGFGSRVVAHERTVYVSAPRSSVNGPERGAVFVLELTP